MEYVVVMLVILVFAVFIYHKIKDKKPSSGSGVGGTHKNDDINNVNKM